MVEQRMVFNAADDGIRVIIQPSLVAVIRQGEIDGAVDAIIGRLVRVQREFADLGVARVGVRSAWLQAVEDDSWDDLVERFRRGFIAPGPSYERGTDLSLAFSSHGEDPGYHVQCGPMDREQLHDQFLPFPEKYESPERLLFADVDYWVSTVSPFNRRRVVDVMREALTFASGFADILSTQFDRNSQ